MPAPRGLCCEGTPFSRVTCALRARSPFSYETCLCVHDLNQVLRFGTYIASFGRTHRPGWCACAAQKPRFFTTKGRVANPPTAPSPPSVCVLCCVGRFGCALAAPSTARSAVMRGFAGPCDTVCAARGRHVGRVVSGAPWLHPLTFYTSFRVRPGCTL